MSKCREEFEKWIATADENASRGEIWQAAWNAATQNAVDICRGHQVYSRRTGTATAAESIEREIEQ